MRHLHVTSDEGLAAVAAETVPCSIEWLGPLSGYYCATHDVRFGPSDYGWPNRCPRGTVGEIER